MKRVGNARTIADIEFVIDPPVLRERRYSWTAWEVDCTRDLHRYSGQAYEFNIQVVDLRHNKAGRISWRALIITESWKADGERGEIRNSKWLKVLDGKTSDIKAWMRRCRSQKVNSTMGLQLSEL